jgi:predicted ATP-grasp superfamily ATP-dependent carboligase
MPLVIIGASTRAAAFSAARAGLQPFCADLFADLDLCARFPVTRLSGTYPCGLEEVIAFFPLSQWQVQHSKGAYPRGFEEVLASDVPGPWMYTGGLENWPRLIAAWQEQRPLWGVRGQCLGWARDPVRVARLLRKAGLPTPETRSRPPSDSSRRWLIKRRHGAGGQGVCEWFADDDVPGAAIPDMYWQEFIDGQPAAALYVGCGKETQLLGLTRQLIGVPWLNAAPFHYCGSIGPLLPSADLKRELTAIGAVLAGHCNLTGLFGVDGVLAAGHFWPVEINPRYTASVEVLEYATGLRALAWHRRAFDRKAPMPVRHPVTRAFVGKAILYAPAELTFPSDGPWLSDLRKPTALHLPPDFADIPAAGAVIPRGRPILTFFVHKARLISCEDALQQVAQELMRRLFPNAPLTKATAMQAADARIVSNPEQTPPAFPSEYDSP